MPFTLVRYRIACTRRNDILVCGRKRICTRSCIDIASPQARRRAACQNQSPTAGVQATSGQRVGLLLVGVERDGPPATSEPPTLSLPSPPSCELVAPCGGETRERSAGAGLALALDSRTPSRRGVPPGLGSCGCVGQ